MAARSSWRSCAATALPIAEALTLAGDDTQLRERAQVGGGSISQALRLRTNVERYVFPQVGQITVSVGFTALRAGDAPAAAFDRADKAVYHAKQNGRNQVADHAALVASGVFADASRDSDVELF